MVDWIALDVTVTSWHLRWPRTATKEKSISHGESSKVAIFAQNGSARTGEAVAVTNLDRLQLVIWIGRLANPLHNRGHPGGSRPHGPIALWGITRTWCSRQRTRKILWTNPIRVHLVRPLANVPRRSDGAPRVLWGLGSGQGCRSSRFRLYPAAWRASPAVLHLRRGARAGSAGAAKTAPLRCSASSRIHHTLDAHGTRKFRYFSRKFHRHNAAMRLRENGIWQLFHYFFWQVCRATSANARPNCTQRSATSIIFKIIQSWNFKNNSNPYFGTPCSSPRANTSASGGILVPKFFDSFTNFDIFKNPQKYVSSFSRAVSAN